MGILSIIYTYFLLVGLLFREISLLHAEQISQVVSNQQRF